MRMLKLIYCSLIFICTSIVTSISYSTDYFYDDLHRLIKAEFSSGDKITYNYDDSGNIIKRQITYSPKISLSSPNTSIQWQRGSVQTIRWDVRGDVGENVRIELRRGNSFDRVIVNSTENDGAYDWQIPGGQPLRSDYKIHIISVSDSTIDDQSDTTFSITSSPASLVSIELTGEVNLNENSNSNYIAEAIFSNGSRSVVTNSTTWSENSNFATINSQGVLSTSEVSENQNVNITATYTYSGVTRSATKTVAINNIYIPIAIPSVPLNVDASDYAYDDKVEISWDSVSGADRYIYFRCVSDEESSCSRANTTTSNTHDDTDGAPDITYHYRVQACNVSGCSALSDSDVGTRKLPVILSSIKIIGANYVVGGKSQQYKVEASYSDGLKRTVTSGLIWSENSRYSSISQTGLLTTEVVSETREALVRVSYQVNGVIKSSSISVELKPESVNIVPLIYPLLF